MTDSYHSQGAASDRARTWKLTEESNHSLGRIATALEKIAEKFEITVVETLEFGTDDQKGSGYDDAG